MIKILWFKNISMVGFYENIKKKKDNKKLIKAYKNNIRKNLKKW